MPFITISRMYGAGGSEIAARVAQMLGWSLFDNAVIDAVAERTGLTRAEVTARDERIPSIVERLATTLSLGTPESMPAIPEAPVMMTEERVVEITRRVIEEAVQQGPAVFVGRGAQCLLAHRRDSLHVFCYAARPKLIEGAVTRLGVLPKDAERVVSEMNKNRELYVRRHFNREWRDVTNYHFCIDTGWLGLDGAADLIVELARKTLR
ncbi:MAG TPA: cytidylate kinase-like family protein [Gemmatimonadaceae bacterium]|nr:cytidylate kinase-like family protein [Gemmatimonadaceae bacterium]